MAASLTSVSIKPMELFDNRKDFARWINRFESYMVAIGLDRKSGRDQVNAFVYYMGPEGEEVFSSFGLTDEEASNYKLVKEKFEDYYFAPRFMSRMCERVEFLRRVQQPNEPLEDFITDLYDLSSWCDYRSFRDDMIRDQLVAGIFDKNLSEYLQKDPKLTLDKAIAIARKAEGSLLGLGVDCEESDFKMFSDLRFLPHVRRRLRNCPEREFIGQMF